VSSDLLNLCASPNENKRPWEEANTASSSHQKQSNSRRLTGAGQISNEGRITVEFKFKSHLASKGLAD
jgi:hypothetical protein